MRKNNSIVTKTSKDVAKALGLTPAHAKEWEVRNAVTKRIIEASKLKKISVSEIARNAGTSRGRVTKILKEDTFGISLDVLVRVLGAVGEEMKISFRKAA